MRKFSGKCITPVITRERCRKYKDDELYKNHRAFIEHCKHLSEDDMELKLLTAYAKKTIDLCFFSKHNQCEIAYDEEWMLDLALKALWNYVSARYHCCKYDYMV